MRRHGLFLILPVVLQAGALYAADSELPRDDNKILEPGCVIGRHLGRTRVCLVDWNNDGKRDVLSAPSGNHGEGGLVLFLNTNTDEAPQFDEPTEPALIWRFQHGACEAPELRLHRLWASTVTASST